ncbi:ArsR family transcriptional regulator [Nonomuraea sp. NPDC026600]|uniref:ArsR/SmtB family transcription factor n=1 Tax=Nonomuraea sp. NPDC026600 TaxID=3155363 RepID=UPI0034046275
MRIHFSAEDLRKTHVAPTFGPLAETSAALMLLRHPSPGVMFRTWFRRVRQNRPPHLRLLGPLYQDTHHGLDLFALLGQAPTVEEGLERLHAAPRAALRTEIDPLLARMTHSPPTWLRSLLAEDRTPVLTALREFHQVAIAPDWTRLRSHLEADRAMRGRILLEGGLDQLLTTLHPPTVRWDPPVLEVRTKGGSVADEYLNGRGLTLVPSVFVGPEPMLSFTSGDPESPLRLVYPASWSGESVIGLWAGGDPADPRDPQAELLGRTRSRMLRLLADDACGTTELAVRLGISPAAASQHTRVLRNSGLITTRRIANTVLHMLTPLGKALVAGTLG